MPIERFMVPGEMEPVSHYCHVVRAGDFVYLSGMVGMKADGTIPPDTVGQFEIALKSIDTCLRHAAARSTRWTASRRRLGSSCRLVAGATTFKREGKRNE